MRVQVQITIDRNEIVYVLRTAAGKFCRHSQSVHNSMCHLQHDKAARKCCALGQDACSAPGMPLPLENMNYLLCTSKQFELKLALQGPDPSPNALMLFCWFTPCYTFICFQILELILQSNLSSCIHTFEQCKKVKS